MKEKKKQPGAIQDDYLSQKEMNFQSINSKIPHNSSIMREGSTQGKWERKERDRDDPGEYIRCCAKPQNFMS